MGVECSIPIRGQTDPSSENVHSNPKIDDCTSSCIPFSSKFLIFPTGGVGGGTPNNTYSDNVFHRLTCLFHCCHATIEAACDNEKSLTWCVLNN